ncbi:MAG: hypothetical protein SFU85_11200 [Candidatus Methylacidiphilales bacterium]|nr:hypothetical protein [Candidatus Methylacidiphilales bacterium]
MSASLFQFNARERVMGMVFLVVVVGIGAWFLWDELAARQAAMVKRQQNVKLQIAEARRWIADKQLWNQRAAWLASELRPAGSTNEASPKFLEQLQKSAAERKLVIGQQGLLDPVEDREFIGVGAKLVFQGPLKEVGQWLAMVQQPGEFVEVTFLELRPLKEAGQVECSAQLRKWYGNRAGSVAQNPTGNPK